MIKIINLLAIFLITANLSASKQINYANLLSSNIDNTVIEFELNDYDLIPINTDNGIEYQIKIDGGSSFLKKGAPDINKFSKSIIIPDNANMKIKILSSEYIEFENINVIPSKGNLLRSINPNDIPYEYGKEYDKNKFFPSSLAALQDPYILRNLRGQTINFHPIQYNPKKELLRIYNKITIEVYVDNYSSAKNILNRNQAYSKKSITKEFKNIYENHFLNFSSDNRFEYLNDRGNMLIISYGSFIETVQSLADWKNKKGIPTEIVNVSDIGSNSSSIENYVSNYYYEKGLTFLLLVGDVAQIPTPYISGSASDPSYGFIEGNDSYAEVIVGRFSGSTPSQISTQVQRSIEYERYPQANANWYDNAMGVASTQGPGYGGYTDAQFNDFLWDTILSDFTYDSYQYSYDGSGSVALGMEIINNGVGLINYTGHGSIGSWGNGAPLSTSNINSLSNESLLPFVISVACNTGEFNSTNECFGESWLRATNNEEPTGGIGFFGSTISMSWEPPMHGQYAMNLILTESYENHITRSIGGIATNGCLYMNDAQGSSGTNETNYWTLFGDPSLELRTDQPASLNINHDSAIVVGQSELNVETGIDNALVAISKNNNLLAYAYSNNGLAIINLSEADLIPGDYDLVVTAFNAFPFESTLSVITPDGPYVTFDTYSIVSENLNSNGLAEYDETIELNLTANNVGVDDAYNVVAEVSTNDPFITLNNNMLNFGNISAGSSAQTGGLNFTIAHNVPDGHNSNFNVIFSNSGSQWEANFSVNIHAPTFTVSNPSFIDAGADGIWDSGETISLNLLLNNEGSADHWNYPGIHLTENSTEAEIAGDIDFFWIYGIESNSSQVIEFQIIASENANMGTEVTFTAYASELNCEQNCIESEPFTFSFTIGLPIDESLYEPLNLVAEAGENVVNLSWEEPFTCPDGQFADCVGQCVDSWYEAWIGDGLCDDGTWGVYFNCDEFNNDGGDCGDILTCEDQGMVTCPNGICEDSLVDCPETSCDVGYVDDCSGDGDCCPESWIGDGYADCEDQAYGCDLTCYDNDGGDCASFNQNNNISEKNDKMYPSRSNLNFNANTISPSNERDAIGYFVFKDGAYIAYTENLFYNDTNIVLGTELCYHITAVYDEGQSGASNIACTLVEGEQGILGDLNNDEIINILDIIIMANMTLGSEEVNYYLADLNNDGIINVLDIIILVNMIINGRSIDATEYLGGNALINQESNNVFISSDGKIAGIQISTNTDQIELNSDLPLTVRTNYHNNKFIILMYGASGETIEGDNILLFSSNEDCTIESVIVANILGEEMNVEINNSLVPNTFRLDQNYPNPFNPKTHIQFNLPHDEILSLQVYDISGRFVNSLVSNSLYSAGYHTILWNGTNNKGTNVPSGVYFYKLIGENQTLTKKMLLIK